MLGRTSRAVLVAVNVWAANALAQDASDDCRAVAPPFTPTLENSPHQGKTRWPDAPSSAEREIRLNLLSDQRIVTVGTTGLSGRVVDSGGRAVSGARVELRAPEYPILRSPRFAEEKCFGVVCDTNATALLNVLLDGFEPKRALEQTLTDERGEFRFSAAEGTHWSVAAISDQGDGFVPHVLAGSRIDFDLTEIQLQPTQLPFEGIAVVVLNRARQIARYVKTDANGAIPGSSFDPRVIAVAIVDPRYQPAILDQRTASRDFHLEPSRPIQGFVEFEGKRVPNVTLKTNQFSTRSDQQGQFSLPRNACTCGLVEVVSDDWSGSLTVSSRDDAVQRLELHRPLEPSPAPRGPTHPFRAIPKFDAPVLVVSPSEAVSDIDFEPAARRRIDGVVVDATTGKPVPARVSLEGAPPGVTVANRPAEPASEPCGEDDDHWAIKRLIREALTAAAPHLATDEPGVFSLYGSVGGVRLRVTSRPGKSPFLPLTYQVDSKQIETVTLRVVPAPAISGQLELKDRALAPFEFGLSLHLRSESADPNPEQTWEVDGSNEGSTVFSAALGQISVDRNGRFETSGLGPGDYLIVFSAPGYQSTECIVRVTTTEAGRCVIKPAKRLH